MISFVLRGQSMAPLLEDGAVFALEQVPATEIWPGQVIVFEVLSGKGEEERESSQATFLSPPTTKQPKRQGRSARGEFPSLRELRRRSDEALKRGLAGRVKAFLHQRSYPQNNERPEQGMGRVEAFLCQDETAPADRRRCWVAHRVVALQLCQGRRAFLTQGDNVPHTDGFVPEERVLGRVAARLQGQRWVPIAGLEEWWALRYARKRRMVRQVLLRLLRYGQRLGERWMSKLLQVNPEIVFRQEEEEAILFHPESGQIQLLNETGALIYQLLDGNHERDEILERLTAEYEADREVLAQDLDEFLLQVEQIGLASVVE
jgi:hypothetical protein